MSPGDALTGKGHVRYSTALADPQEADQQSPTSSCAQNSQICTALVLIGIKPAPAQNEHLFVSKSRAERGPPLDEGVLCPGLGPLFPPRGIIGSRAGASRTPCGRRCAAGLRPVLDPATRSRGVAAEREREQECLRLVGP